MTEHIFKDGRCITCGWYKLHQNKEELSCDYIQHVNRLSNAAVSAVVGSKANDREDT